MKKLVLFLALLVGISFADITVRGTLTASNGEAPKLAHVHAVQLGESVFKPLKSVEAKADGSFELQLPNDNYYTLYITGVDHYGHEVPLLAENDQTVELTFQMPGYNYLQDLSNVSVIGDFNDFNFRAGEKMLLDDEGKRYVLKVETDADKMGYQLLNVEQKGHSINGTQATSYKYDGGGDYVSFVDVKDGVAHIIFDPAKLPGGGGEAKITFNKAKHQKIIQIAEIADAYKNRYLAAARAHREKTGDYEGFDLDASEVLAALDDYMSEKNAANVRAFAAAKMAGLSLTNEDDLNQRAQKIIKLLPINHKLWATAPSAMSKVHIAANGPEALAFLEKNILKIQGHNTQAVVLTEVGLLQQQKENKEAVARIHKSLTENYGDVRDVQYYVKELDPNKAIAKGNDVPDFEVKLLNSDETVSNKSLLGQYYLMDFWAVWCGPCRAEMPQIHEAFKEFSGDRFTILSLSFDRRPEDIAGYREKSWPMPWLHTFVDGGFRSELAQNFEVMGIPKPILVNPEGKIVATGSELRGTELKKTLAKFLNTAM